MIKAMQKPVTWDRENTNFLLLLLATVVVVYLSPNVIITRFLFLLLLIPIAISRKDYFWLAWFFVIMDGPGNLFGGNNFRDIVQRVPIYPITSGISIAFKDLFYLLMFAKALKKHPIHHYIFKKEFTLFWLLTAGLVIYTIMIQINMVTMVRMFRTLLPWTLVFAIVRLMDTERSFFHVAKLLFPMLFFVLASQIYAYITGLQWHDALTSGFSEHQYEVSMEEGIASRAGSSSMIIFFSLISALYYRIKNTSEFRPLYLNIIIFLCVLSAFLTATRGWIMAMGVMFLLMLFIMPSNLVFRRLISLIAFGTIIYYVLSIAFPIIGFEAESAFSRLETVTLVMQGDETAGGTLQRLDIRAPKVWGQAKESLTLGYGFSNKFYEYSDPHVSHLNIILNSGIIGTIILNFIFFGMIYRIWHLSNNKNLPTEKIGAVRVFAIGLVGIFIIHSSSGQMWGYTGMIASQALFAFLLGFVSAISNSIQPKRVPVNTVLHNFALNEQ